MVEAEDFTGRARELDRLGAFLDKVDSVGAALCLYGDPGVGKTTLLDVAVGSAGRRGLPVHRAAGGYLESDLSWATLHQLLLQLIDDAERRDTAEQVLLDLTVAPAPGYRTVASAVYDLLKPADDEPATLVVVDDLQWVDEASRAVLNHLAARVVGSRIGLLAAIQSAAAPSSITLATLEITAPDQSFVASLIDTNVWGDRHGRDRLLAAGQGNALAMLELGTVIEADRRFGRVEPLVPALPFGRLQRSYARLLAALPARTRRSLLLAALNDGPYIDLPDLAADLAAARYERVLVDAEQGGWLRFRHPLLRAAVVAMSTTQERVQAHRELADLHTGTPHRRAWHIAAVSLQPDESLAHLLDDVARRSLAEGQPVTAITAMLRAAELSTDAVARSRRLAQAASIGTGIQGDILTARELLDDAAHIAGPDGARSLTLAVAAAQLLIDTDGDVETAHRLLTASIDAVGHDLDPGDDLVAALFELCEVCRVGARPLLWTSLDALLARLHPQLPPLLRLRVDAMREPTAVTDADLTEMDGLLRELAEASDPVRINRIAGCALMLDRGPECRPALNRIIDEGRTGGAVRSAIVALSAMSLDLFAAGDWDAAVAAGQEATRMSGGRGFAVTGRLCRIAPLYVAAARGDDDLVRTETNELITWAAPRGLGILLFWGYQLQATAALGRGDFEQAFQLCSAICAPGTVPPNGFTTRAAFDLVEAALRTGRPEDAARHTSTMRQARIDRLTPRLALMVGGAAAMVADDKQAPDLFAEALAVPGADRFPWDVARIRLLHGERLRRLRSTARARAELTTALTMFRRLGARPWADRATRELAATRHGSPTPGPFALTPQERETAELAATGLTNRQIADRLLLSPRTVAAHLRQTYRKLAITSRGALGDALGPQVRRG